MQRATRQEPRTDPTSSGEHAPHEHLGDLDSPSASGGDLRREGSGPDGGTTGGRSDGPAAARPPSDHDLDTAMVRTRQIRVESPRLDDVVHRAIQLALLGVSREVAPDMASLDDLRLAVDETLLDRAITRELPVAVVVSTSPAEVVVEVRVDDPDLLVPHAILSALVDDVDVRVEDDATTVTLRRRWGDHGNGAPDG